ncbi:MAG: hypothetical protein K2F77_06185 [Muribaculaceae bacterium]|nr:hypothetical protein [Muribaculaceae bacterium]
MAPVAKTIFAGALCVLPFSWNSLAATQWGSLSAAQTGGVYLVTVSRAARR